MLFRSVSQSRYCIACYDDFTLEFASDRRQDSVCTGSDADIMKMIEMDAPFYQRGNIDRAPVSTSEEVNK